MQVVTYVVTRPGRELLFTVVSQDEKYKAKVWNSLLVLKSCCSDYFPTLRNLYESGRYA